MFASPRDLKVSNRKATKGSGQVYQSTDFSLVFWKAVIAISVDGNSANHDRNLCYSPPKDESHSAEMLLDRCAQENKATDV